MLRKLSEYKGIEIIEADEYPAQKTNSVTARNEQGELWYNSQFTVICEIDMARTRTATFHTKNCGGLTNGSESTAQRAIMELVSQGYITFTHRRRAHGLKQSSLYRCGK